jgi:uncharacterized membrane protein YfcA
MEYALIAIVALCASFLTFFSGFGLGTILTPIFAIFYGVETAVALTAIVHLLNNLFKLALVFPNVNWKLILKFGVPSMLAAFAGAWIMQYSGHLNKVIFVYQLSGKEFSVDSVRLCLGSLIAFFAFFELSKKLSSLSFNERYLVPGALLSGFLGGFSGHQGALRSAFLLRLNLEKSIFIASGVFIACMVDLARIPVYMKSNLMDVGSDKVWLLATAVLAAWIGAFAGNKIFKKTSLAFFKWLVGIFMLVMGVLIVTGVVR